MGNTTKLTLSADRSLIVVAKRLAAERNTSVSALFSRLVRALERVQGTPEQDLAPVTRRVSGIVELPAGKDDRDILADALADLE